MKQSTSYYPLIILCTVLTLNITNGLFKPTERGKKYSEYSASDKRYKVFLDDEFGVISA